MPRAFIDAKMVAARDALDVAPRDRQPGAIELEVEYDGGVIPVGTLEPIEVAPGKEPELTPVQGKRCMARTTWTATVLDNTY